MKGGEIATVIDNAIVINNSLEKNKTWLLGTSDW